MLRGVRSGISWVLYVVTGLVWAQAAQAAFHLYDIAEVYSNAEGSVQFVEFFTAHNGQQFLDGHAIVASQGAASSTFTFVGSGHAGLAMVGGTLGLLLRKRTQRLL